MTFFLAVMIGKVLTHCNGPKPFGVRRSVGGIGWNYVHFVGFDGKDSLIKFHLDFSKGFLVWHVSGKKNMSSCTVLNVVIIVMLIQFRKC